ncbi:MAG TPA: YihY/virulence factor BrkB family protein [Actinomycetales bacterium]|nr:YihY/virulence factor BrkB family protein [Actinomycetales bacterium]
MTKKAPKRATPDHSLAGRAKKLLAWYQNSRIARTLKRYSTGDGSVLAGGIAYAALFSVFAGLTIGWTVFMAVLGDNDTLREAVLQEIDNFAPGIVDTGDGQGVIKPEQLIRSQGFSIAGIIAVVVLAFSATRFVNATRVAVRSMFGMERLNESFVAAKLKDVTGLATFGLAVLGSAAASVVVGISTGWLLGLFGAQDTDAGRLLIKALGFVVVWVVDTITIVLVIRVVAAAKPPTFDLLVGSAGGAIGIGVLKVLGTSVVGGSSDPLMASFAAIITLLLWVNIMARVMLYTAAWIANPPLPGQKDSLLERIPAP